jgi:hypothetical protein
MATHFDENFKVDDKDLFPFDEKIREEGTEFGPVEYMFAVNAKGEARVFVRNRNKVTEVQEKYQEWRRYYENMIDDAKKRGCEYNLISVESRGNEHKALVGRCSGAPSGQPCPGYNITVRNPTGAKTD